MTNNEESLSYLDEDIDLRDLLKEFWQKKVWIVSIATFSFLIAVIYALSLPNIYTATTLLKPTQSDQGGIGNSLRAYSGIANLAGISVPSAEVSNTDIAIEKLKSLNFFENEFLSRIKLENLMAIHAWDAKNNSIRYNQSDFLATNNTWVRKVAPPKNVIPSAQEAHQVFLEDFFRVQQNDDTGFVKLSIDHQSPHLAKKWLEILIKQINSVLREEQKQNTLKSIGFLSQQISSTDYAEVKEVIASVLQTQTEKLMLIEVNEDYIFQAIDPPFAPEVHSKPNRITVCLIGLFFGGTFGLLFIAIRYFYKKRN